MRVAGGTLSDVVSVRIYIVARVFDESRHIGDALKELFSKHQVPATTWLVVKAVANKDYLIGIEVIAVIN